ncbi:sugar phosphate isomerase/epimerase, partial [Ruminococcaceae bacterium OttesenSCG-928-L11]|nr:sugar phosphate isomerase/epimerase [Ruminococcaceae bacterium OttesenSCG-928-L11]
MDNILAATSGFFKEPTAANWARAREAGLTDTELCLSREWPIANILDQANAMFAMFQEAGIRVSSTHLPFDDSWDISAVDEPRCANALAGLKQLVDWASEKGIGIAVLHPSYEPITDDERPARLAKAAASIKDLAAYAREKNVRIAVENLPRTCLGNCSADMLALTNHGKDADMCFDCNHLLMESHRDFLGAILPYVITTHFSDYDRVDERHWLVGDGCIDWPELLSLFEGAGYKGRYLFELNEGASPSLGRPFTPA